MCESISTSEKVSTDQLCKYKRGNNDKEMSENPEMGVRDGKRRQRAQGPR